ncbi:hypothetical protein HDU96_008981 [Phlyctochytrium bullatum]|nr:hypothetical protein HDU96_008981 [Phlyctochytrium bullatum]
MTVDVWAAIDYLFLRGHHGFLLHLVDTLRIESPELREVKLRPIWHQLHAQQAHEYARWQKREAGPRGPEEKEEMRSRVHRFQMPLRNARRVFGVADGWEVVPEDGCVVRVTMPDGSVKTVTGTVAVTRNPCYHPGDVVLLQAVEAPGLEFLRDVLVFSVKGRRPAADRCSGGDLDGDTFLVIWEEEIVGRLRPCEPFDYGPASVARVIEGAAAELGVPIKKPAATPFYRKPKPGSKTDLIDALTSPFSVDTFVAKIDAAVLALRQFKFKDPLARDAMPRARLLEVLNALFSAGIDEFGGPNLAVLVEAIEKRIVNARTAAGWFFVGVGGWWWWRGGGGGTFQQLVRRHRGAVWGFFAMSAGEGGDEAWREEAFLERFVPPMERPNVDLAVKVLKLAERLTRDVVGATPILSEEMVEVFGRCLPGDLVGECASVARAGEAFVNNLQHDVGDEPLKELQVKYEAVVEAVRVAREEGREVGALEKEKAALSVEILERLDLISEMKEVKEIWTKANARFRALGRVFRNAYKVLTELGGARRVDPKVVKDTEKILRQEVKMYKSGLPIYDSRDSLVEFIETASVGLVLSATGSGKSTCIPHFLANELFFVNKLSSSKQIIVAQPRRQATLSLAERLAESRETLVGHEVGRHIGKSKALVTKYRTLINCTTYGILLYYARRDPLFSGYSVVVLDEVHEDSGELYFLFGIIKRALRMNRELKLLLMSAKVDSKRLVEYFGACEVIEVSGRGHPIQEFYGADLITMSLDQVRPRVFDKIMEIHRTFPIDANPDILVFLPTSSLIESCAECLQDHARSTLGAEAAAGLFGFALHSGVADEEKRFVLQRGRVEDWEVIREEEEESDDEEEEERDEVDEVFGALWRALQGEGDETPTAVSSEEAESEGRCASGDDDDAGSLVASVEGEDSNVTLEHSSGSSPTETSDTAEALADEKSQTKNARKKEREQRKQAKIAALKRMLEGSEETKTLNDGTRRVIFCTNIAETSLTIPQVGYVIDAGLQFSVTRRATLNLQTSELVNTTQVSAVQRKGRAGRLGPGKCYRLYTEEDAKALPEQIVSAPEQLDCMLLSIIDMFDHITDFDWFAPPSPEDLEWTLMVLKDCRFVERRGDGKLVVTEEGRIAMDLGRLQVPAQAARFLIDVWRSRAASSKLKQHCAVLAAMHAVGSGKGFGQAFSYNAAVNGKTDLKGRQTPPEAEEIPCPGKVFYTLPATICKINVYWMWRRKQSSTQQKKFCKNHNIRRGDMQEIHVVFGEIMKYMKGRSDLTPVNEWAFDPDVWDETKRGFGNDDPFELFPLDNAWLDDPGYDSYGFYDDVEIDTVATPTSVKEEEKPTEKKAPADDDELYFETDATHMEPGAQIAFIMEHLIKAFPTNVALVRGTMDYQAQPIHTALFKINEKFVMGKVDRNEVKMFGHCSEGCYTPAMFSSVKMHGGFYYVAHVDRVPEALLPKEVSFEALEAAMQAGVCTGL